MAPEPGVLSVGFLRGSRIPVATSVDPLGTNFWTCWKLAHRNVACGYVAEGAFRANDDDTDSIRTPRWWWPGESGSWIRAHEEHELHAVAPTVGIGHPT